MTTLQWQYIQRALHLKEVREITGWGLKESKDYVENL